MKMSRVVVAIVALLLLCGCGGGTRMRTVTVPVPPRVDLQSFPLVGLVTFSSNTRDGLDRISTQRFLQAVQDAQPGTRVIELGTESQVLASVGRSSWDPATLAAVKKAHRVDVVIVGRLDVERSKPSFQLSTLAKQLNAKVDVNAELNCRLLETETGATRWADGAAMTANLGHASIGQRNGDFSAHDPEAFYGQMIDGLVAEVTGAFRTHYVRRRVPAEPVVASVE